MPRFFDGPTGDVNTAFVHKMQELLKSSSLSSSSTGAPITAAVRSFPIYSAVIRFVEQTKEYGKQKQDERLEGSKGGCSSALVVPSALARRGVGPKDPLLQRKLRKQQHQRQRTEESLVLSDSLPLPVVADNTDSGGERWQVAPHWSQRLLQEMTPAGWDVFREQIGVFVEVVSRRELGQQEQQQNQEIPQLPKFTSATLRPIRSWEEARLPLALGTLVARRYFLPTPIQAQCVPLAMASVATPSGKVDVLGVAETGSGKTAAYLIPVLADVLRRTPRLLGNDALIAHGPLALVMVPTRELAEQVTREAQAFMRGLSEAELKQLVREEYMGEDDHDVESVVVTHNTLDEVRIVKIVGGEQAEAQYNELAQGAHVVVGTLGQLESLLQQRFLALGNTRMVVMDEVDRMIEEQQKDRLIAVLERCPLPRQTIMFTATLSATCEEVARKYFSPAGFVVVRVPARCSTITQVVELMPSDPYVAPTFFTMAGENRNGVSVGNDHVSGGAFNNMPDKQQELERRCNSLLHPIKFGRLVAHLAYATPPIVVFANEKRTCDLLYDELRAEAAHLGALANDFSPETIIGEVPPVLRARQNDVHCHSNHNQLSFQQKQTERGPAAPNFGNMRSIALVHSEQSQAERQRLVELFRRGERSVLLTTDLLSRGLDVPNVSLVINYDLPRVNTAVPVALSATAGEEAVQKYIHRIGRTGRAGASGVAVSFLCLPSLLINRAKQHVQRGANNNNSIDYSEAVNCHVQNISATTKTNDIERNELAQLKCYEDLYKNIFTLCDDAEESEDDGNNDDGPPRSRHRTETRSVAACEKDKASSRMFSSDELLLQPLWNFFVSCAESAFESLSGAEIIRQQRCKHVQLPNDLVALMMAFTRGSPYGSITT